MRVVRFGRRESIESKARPEAPGRHGAPSESVWAPGARIRACRARIEEAICGRYALPAAEGAGRPFQAAGSIGGREDLGGFISTIV